MVEVHPETRVEQMEEDQGLRNVVASLSSVVFGQAFGKRLEQLSRVYGLAVVISCVVIVFVLAFAGIPWTVWKEGEVPVADYKVYFICFYSMLAFAFAVRCVFSVGSNDPLPDPSAPYYSWKYVRATFAGVFGAVSYCVQ